MNIIRKLQDPQLVADFQYFFGVRPYYKNRNDKPVYHNNDTSKLDSKYEGGTTLEEEDLPAVRQRHPVPKAPSSVCQPEFEVTECGNQNKESSQSKWADQNNFLSVKSHIRQGSTASVGSNVSTGSSQSWADYLLGDGAIGGTEGSMDEDNTMSESESDELSYEILNRFWYVVFQCATEMGGEIFYAAFFCTWTWNVDGAVLRRVITIWMITMYFGQALKDILKVPRPACPPVVRLDPKWALEYGLPSTHAMFGASVPFSLLILTTNRYQLPWLICLAGAITWCLLVCGSRIYLGMHSVLDIVTGLILTAIILAVTLPWVDTIDQLALTHPWSPVICIILTIAMVVCYPATDRWTPARGDTAVIVGVGCGSLLGAWVNYQLGVIREPSLPPPYTVLWPTFNMMGLSLLRTILGLVVLVAIRAIFKSLSFATVCTLLKVNANDYHSKTSKVSAHHRIVVELTYKFITYIAIGFTVSYTAPLTFRLIGIERPTFYTEL
ncbi:sphingosine-1-phosphate phosphatase 2-like [Oratosquilla oratoria]|uniref:sphingosine-1-phosphate phosphatase 2-like n=1 Tax=Oratosquilla oratoria TaxID=337810 RepID=UPI003F76469D